MCTSPPSMPRGLSSATPRMVPLTVPTNSLPVPGLLIVTVTGVAVAPGYSGPTEGLLSATGLALAPVLLALASLLAGALNSVAGGGSFFTFPSLIAAGVPPIEANVSRRTAVSCSSSAT